MANPCFYALATLAYDLLQALKLLYLPDSEVPKRVRTLIQHLLLIPVEMGRHARQIKASLYVTAGWVVWVVGGAVAEVATTGCGSWERLRGGAFVPMTSHGSVCATEVCLGEA